MGIRPVGDGRTHRRGAGGRAVCGSARPSRGSRPLGMRPAQGVVGAPGHDGQGGAAGVTGTCRAVSRWCAAVVGTGCLIVAGRRLGIPPVLHPDLLARWWTGRSPVVATFATARGFLACVGCCLVARSAVPAAAAVLSRSGTAVATMRRWRPPGVGRMVLAVIGASAAGPVVTGAAAPASADPAPANTDPAPPGAPPVMRYLGPPGPDGAGTFPPSTGPPRTGLPRPQVPHWVATAGPPDPARRRPTVTPASGQHRTGGPVSSRPALSGTEGSVPPSATPAGPTASATTERPGSPARPVSRGPRRPPALASDARSCVRNASRTQWIVRPGDDLWTIAERTLASAWGRPPSTRGTAGYWLSVIAANRSQLPDPADPSLLFPGDVVRLPAVPSSPSADDRSN
jgi:nucleoid-associated protein YgaU